MLIIVVNVFVGGNYNVVIYYCRKIFNRTKRFKIKNMSEQRYYTVLYYYITCNLCINNNKYLYLAIYVGHNLSYVFMSPKFSFNNVIGSYNIVYIISMKMRLSFQVFVMYYHLCLYSITGDQSKPYVGFEYRSFPTDIRAKTLSFPNSFISPHSNHATRQQIIHTSAMQSHPVPNLEKPVAKNSEFSFSDQGINGLSEEHHQNLREMFRDFVHNHFPHNDKARQSYDVWTSRPFQESYDVLPTIVPEPTNKTSPKFSLIESVTAKTSSKMSGLMELVFALLGSGSNNNFIMRGLRDVVLNGILKPLMATSGGIKILVSKLSIPIISLLLINVEILAVVWWLWDDCPASEPPQPSTPTSSSLFSSPSKSHNYDGYNSTYG